MKLPMPTLLRGDARHLPLPDASVDLVVTSPPYFGLRDYGTPDQLGAEPTPAEFIDTLIACTAEMMRVLKPAGSIFLNLGDTYARNGGGGAGSSDGTTGRNGGMTTDRGRPQTRVPHGTREKCLLLLPERYRIAAVDQLGLIARAVIVWSKPNGLPESVTDRVRRSHEDWAHLTKAPRYFASVDEIREQYNAEPRKKGHLHSPTRGYAADVAEIVPPNPLGKLPGSVWSIATQPLKVPADLGVDHFAAFPMEWPRRLIQGWCPREVCTVCGEGRRPVTEGTPMVVRPSARRLEAQASGNAQRTSTSGTMLAPATRTITGYACACPDTTAPSTPGVVLDPFGGTGTTALVASMLGRHGISVDLSADYCRLAAWRAADPKERARAAGLDPDAVTAIRPQLAGQGSLFDDGAAS